MINWNKELEKIFEDPLFADVNAPRKRTTSSDRLIAGFQEILAFYETNGRLPEDVPAEASLFHKWTGLLKSEKKIERCRPFDNLGILPQYVKTMEEPQSEYHRELTEEEQLETILNDPLLADIETGDDLGLFNLPDYMRQRLEARKEAEYVGKRRPCEDFHKYADGFKEIQQGLKSGKYKLIKFEEPHVKQGRYFIEQGAMVYIAGSEDIKKNKFGRKDGRIRCIYENGSESDILKLTLCKNIYTNGGYSIENNEEVSDLELEQHFMVNKSDIESGIIYVLRSKSKHPEISCIKNLYKIGFTTTSIESRIANAVNEPTYLCSDVDVVASWKVYNIKSSTFEALIHKLFAGVQLQVTVDGYHPKEWFIVPLKIIEKAVTCIIKGQPIMYDSQLQQIILL